MNKGCILLLLFSHNAFAHHSATTKVSSQTTDRQSSPSLSFHWQAGLAYRFDYFSRTRAGSHAHRGSFGTIRLDWVVPSIQRNFENGMFLSSRLPLGRVHISAIEGGNYRNWGLGDFTFLAGKQWQQKNTWFRLTTGLTAPTGEFDSESVLTKTEVFSEEPGKLELTTFRTHANLGGGVWAINGEVTGGLRLNPRLSMQLSGMHLRPLGKTSDGFQWGSDTLVEWANVVNLKEQTALFAGAGYLMHTQDRAAPAANSLFPTEQLVQGSRHQVHANIGIRTLITTGVVCGAHGTLPFWQQVGGVQLTSTATVSIRCSIQNTFFASQQSLAAGTP